MAELMSKVNVVKGLLFRFGCQKVNEYLYDLGCEMYLINKAIVFQPISVLKINLLILSRRIIRWLWPLSMMVFLFMI